MHFVDGLWYGECMTNFKGYRFPGDERAVQVTVAGVTTTGTLIAGIGNNTYGVKLDGTGQIVFPTGNMLSETEDE